MLGSARMMAGNRRGPGRAAGRGDLAGRDHDGRRSAHARVQSGALCVHRSGGRGHRALAAARAVERGRTPAQVMTRRLRRPSTSSPTTARPTSSSAWSTPSSTASPPACRSSTSPTRSPPSTWPPAPTCWCGARRTSGPGVVLAVVDPGVGTDRRAIAVAPHPGAPGRSASPPSAEAARTGPAWLVGPDNGLLLPLAAAARRGRRGLARSTRPPPTGGDGRSSPGGADLRRPGLFAPAAAHLVAGGDPAVLGPAIDPATLVVDFRPSAPGAGSTPSSPGDAVHLGDLDRPVRQRPARRSTPQLLEGRPASGRSEVEVTVARTGSERRTRSRARRVAPSPARPPARSGCSPTRRQGGAGLRPGLGRGAPRLGPPSGTEVRISALPVGRLTVLPLDPHGPTDGGRSARAFRRRSRGPTIPPCPATPALRRFP